MRIVWNICDPQSLLFIYHYSQHIKYTKYIVTRGQITQDSTSHTRTVMCVQNRETADVQSGQTTRSMTGNDMSLKSPVIQLMYKMKRKKKKKKLYADNMAQPNKTQGRRRKRRQTGVS